MTSCYARPGGEGSTVDGRNFVTLQVRSTALGVGFESTDGGSLRGFGLLHVRNVAVVLITALMTLENVLCARENRYWI